MAIRNVPGASGAGATIRTMVLTIVATLNEREAS